MVVYLRPWHLISTAIESHTLLRAMELIKAPYDGLILAYKLQMSRAAGLAKAPYHLELSTVSERREKCHVNLVFLSEIEISVKVYLVYRVQPLWIHTSTLRGTFLYKPQYAKL